jgi:signal transduction histidine kinase
MKRLRLFIVLFGVAVSIPLAFVIFRTYAGIAAEERGQLSFFAETLFDRMEKELGELIEREENRAVDEYRHTMEVTDGKPRRSPLADPPAQPYILGYLQNNPDGSFQTPLLSSMDRVPPNRRDVVERLNQVNDIFNGRKYQIAKSLPPPAPAPTQAEEKKKGESAGFAERYISKSESKNAKSYLGQKETRLEEITQRQALNIASEKEQSDDRGKIQSTLPSPQADAAVKQPLAAAKPLPEAQSAAPAATPRHRSELDSFKFADSAPRFQVEVAPFQSVIIDPERVFIFRRIAIDNQVYRQGFVLLAEPFLRHLAQEHFDQQPMAGFTALSLVLIENGERRPLIRTGVATTASEFSAERVFAAPYGFLAASLNAKAIPTSPARQPLNYALLALGSVLLLGLFAIYQSARAVMDLSERRSRFVSSVTHELKTPLTNIRMYIEMLENGIAASPQREQEYLRILGSESGRLGRLIDNVLELSRLEKRRRRFQLQTGRLEDVLHEVQTVMSQKLIQEGFTLEIQRVEVPPFAYDREVLLQILLNLIENSVKFGRREPRKRIVISARLDEGWVRLAVADTGPGIPRHALKKIFDDFYRVDNELTRNAGGTGLGLALVKKFAVAMGGRVQAANNPDGGCTITLFLPFSSPAPK